MNRYLITWMSGNGARSKIEMTCRLDQAVNRAGEIWGEEKPVGRVNIWEEYADVLPLHRAQILTDGTLDFVADVSGGFDLIDHIERQKLFSLETFGPGYRPDALIAHMKKEIAEIEKNLTDPSEFVDLFLLCLDGLIRLGFSSQDIAREIKLKFTINQARKWPDWRTVEPGIPIEHIKEDDPLEGIELVNPIIEEA